MKLPARTRRFALTAALLGSPSAWLGCNLIFDIEPGNVVQQGASDASVADSSFADTPKGTPGDAASADTGKSGPIFGKEVAYFASDLTVSHVNVDFTNAGIAAYVQHDDGGTDVYPMTEGKGDGTFRIDGVPPGAVYYIRFPPLPNTPSSYALNTYAFSDSRAIDMSGYNTGRVDTQYADAGADAAINTIVSTLTYDLHGLDPVSQAGGAQNIFSVGAAGAVLGIGAGDPITGVPPFPNSFNYDPDGGYFVGKDPVYQGTPLIDGRGSNDTTYVTATVPLDAGIDPAYAPQVTVQGFSTTSLVLTNSGNATLSGTFVGLDASVLPDGGAIQVTWDRGSFVGATGDISTTPKIGSQELLVYASPFGSAGPYAQSPALYDYALYGAKAADPNPELLRLTYGDPYPASWGRYVMVYIFVRTGLDLGPDAGIPDGGSSTFTTNGFIQCAYRLEDVVGKSVRPLVSPPRNVRINGSPSNGTRTGIGTEPTVEWDPPTTGPATSYGFGVKEITYDPARKRPIATVTAYIVTTPTITHFRVPPGILIPGHKYVFSVRAGLGNAPDELNNYGLPFCVTNATTGLLSP